MQPVQLPILDTPMALDFVLSRITHTFSSRKQAAKAIWRGEVRVNETVIKQAGFKVSGQERISFTKANSIQPPPQLKLPLEVIFEDQFMAIINKPPGIEVPAGRPRNIEAALAHNLSPSTAPDALGQMRAVHRLDAPTGGLLVIAKTQTALQHLSEQFALREIEKNYFAVLHGRFIEPITVTTPLDEKPAWSRFIPLIQNRDYTLVKVKIKTGRTHQIRRHAAEIGTPIRGDRKYAPLTPTGKGLFLFAGELGLMHPIFAHPLTFQLPLPSKFYKIMLKR